MTVVPLYGVLKRAAGLLLDRVLAEQPTLDELGKEFCSLLAANPSRQSAVCESLARDAHDRDQRAVRILVSEAGARVVPEVKLGKVAM